MSPSNLEQAERRAVQRLQRALEQHHHTTIIAVSLGVVAGVAIATGIAIWTLTRTRNATFTHPDDPDAPLFV